MINDEELAEQEQADKEATQKYEEHAYQDAANDYTSYFTY